ncbi:class I SAM-dependent methyltransferase [Alkalitalea saponilacus]|uniref:class I SAM-dependent methyltransferase n=1 Tax=Alkalitalea saponilacus TaxID=889453 RepID=UPI001E5AEC0A|nr:class I SAM-dependent methyltransferase [Alkalitalea saponilacus]
MNGSHQNLRFLVDDAQQLKNIPDNSVDVFLCIESAFHYPDKQKFIKEMRRVLKPSGTFLIADLLASSRKKRYFLERWKKKMNFHHWTKEEYLQAFKEQGLKLTYDENITKPVIDGYTDFGSWVPQNKFKYYTGYLWYKLFVLIQVKVNIYLLKKRRHYYVFAGKIG